MKKQLRFLLYPLALSAMALITARAQQSGTIPGLGPSSSWPSPEEIVSKLDQQLSLSDAQKAKLTPIITQRQEQLKALESDSSRPATRAHKLQFIYSSSELRINQVLNKQQRVKYAAIERQTRQQATQRPQARKPSTAAHPLSLIQNQSAASKLAMPKFNPIQENGPRLVVSNKFPELHDRLFDAIAARRQVSFIYQGKLRIAEPHDYGMQNGQARLLSFQIRGQSRSGRLPDWRIFDVNKMSDFKMLDETFPGNRPARQHYQWDKLFIRVGEPE